jgi:hypothetical protein
LHLLICCCSYRFERKKKVEIAIEAMKTYRSMVDQKATSSSTTSSDKSILVVAGGFDHVVSENVNYLQVITTP